MRKQKTSIIYTHGGGRFANQLYVYAKLLAFCLEYPERFTIYNIAICPYNDRLRPGACYLGNSTTLLARIGRFVINDHRVLRLAWKFSPNANKLLIHVFYYFAKLYPRTKILDFIDVSGIGAPFAQKVWSTGVNDKTNIHLSDQKILDLLSEKPRVVMFGFGIECDELLIKHRNAIIEKLALADVDNKKVESLIGQAKDNGDHIVGVHIRHGDFRHISEEGVYYSIHDYLLTMKKYKRANNKYNVIFVICSDECQEKSTFGDERVLIARDTSPSDDLTILSMCDAIICSRGSTFSVWAAYMGNVPTVYVNAPT